MGVHVEPLSDVEDRGNGRRAYRGLRGGVRRRIALWGNGSGVTGGWSRTASGAQVVGRWIGRIPVPWLLLDTLAWRF